MCGLINYMNIFDTVLNGAAVILVLTLLILLLPIILPLWIIGKIALKCGIDIRN